MGIIERAGFKLDYRIEGEGPDLLIIGSPLYYARIFSQNLRTRFRLIFANHRGFVRPPENAGKEAYELDLLVEDLEALRQKLNLEKLILFGHSGHGYMALRYAQKYPEHVTHLVMAGISPDLSSETHAAALAYFEKNGSPERKAAQQKRMQMAVHDMASRLIQLGPRNWYDFNYDPTPLWEGVYCNMPMMDYVWGELFRDIDISAGTSIPTLIALGRHDYIVAPPSSWEALLPAFPNSIIKIFEKSGHTPMLEEPAAFDETFRRFLIKY